MHVIKKATPISAIKANLTNVKALRPKTLDDLNDIAGIGSLVPRSRITFADMSPEPPPRTGSMPNTTAPERSGKGADGSGGRGKKKNPNRNSYQGFGQTRTQTTRQRKRRPNRPR